MLWVGVALLALVSAGCSNSNTSGSAAYDAAPPQAAQNNAAPQEKQGQGNTPAAVQPVQQQERQLVRTATVDLRSDDVLKAIGEVKNRAQAAGGFAGQENSTKERGTVTVRVPSAELDNLVKNLDGQVGEVTRSEVRSEDVTDQLVDVEARIATQKASVERLRVLFERAGTTAEIAQIESELTKRQSELESMQRRSESLKGKVALATLTVQVSTVPIAPPAPVEAGFGSAFLAGWHAVVTVFKAITVGVGALLPFVLVLGVPAAAVIYVLRRRKRVTRTNEAA
ncbi:lipoprotein [Lentzea flava]|uniref:Lipoprotein n=1 Tax=Lentzea flava TaxID=103732 RepID=A0ABQ2UFA1_9PSEU|nr:lipoprotein [Lentzea flava]